jgi:hypothetical protein
MRGKLKPAGRNDQSRTELLFEAPMSKYVSALTVGVRTFPSVFSFV